MSKPINVDELTLSEADTASVSTSILSSYDLDGNSTLNSNILLYVDVENILDEYLNCTKGRIIKQFFKNFKRLGHHQSALANLIIEKEVDRIVDVRKIKISSDRLLYLANLIEKSFPGEKANVFYVPYNCNTRSLATGKLWTAYNKLKQKLRASFSLREQDQDQEDYCDSISDNKLEYLKTNVSPWDKIIQYWTLTYEARKKWLNSCTSKNIIEYFEEFPALKSKKEIFLLEIDFKTIFKNQYNDLFESWHSINKKIINIAKNKTGKKPEINRILDLGEVELAGLLLLPFILHNNFSRKRDSEEKPVRLTKTECADIFILQVPNFAELSEKRESLRKRLQLLKKTVQPFVIFVGEAIIKAFVDIDNHLYEADSPLQAVDLCFKAFHATNALYPIGAEPVWTFIQKAVYKINTAYDKSYISVNNLIRDLN